MIITSRARDTLVQRLYLNTRCGVVFGQQRGFTLHVHSFAASPGLWTEPVTEGGLNWRGWWYALNDQTNLAQPPRTDLVLSAGWDHTGTLIIRTRTVGGEIPVHLP